MDLVEFLTARYDEAEKCARSNKVFSDAMRAAWPGLPEGISLAQAERRTLAAIKAVSPYLDREFVLADIAAKRKLLKLHIPERDLRIRDGKYVEDPPRCTVCTMPYPKRGNWQPYPCDVFRLLAAPYGDHPDFDPAWRTDD